MFHDHGWGIFWFGPLFWIIIMAVIIFFVVSISRRNKGSGNYPQHETPLDILKKRYARGEINKEQYEQSKKDLE